jgi:hypothetical protein
MTLASFRARFSEFSLASDALVQAALDEAETRAGDDDTMIGYLAAHILAISPGGRAIRNAQNTSAKDQETTPYWREYLMLARQRGAGPWVV